MNYNAAIEIDWCVINLNAKHCFTSEIKLPPVLSKPDLPAASLTLVDQLGISLVHLSIIATMDGDTINKLSDLVYGENYLKSQLAIQAIQDYEDMLRLVPIVKVRAIRSILVRLDLIEQFRGYYRWLSCQAITNNISTFQPLSN